MVLSLVSDKADRSGSNSYGCLTLNKHFNLSELQILYLKRIEKMNSHRAIKMNCVYDSIEQKNLVHMVNVW